jgi:hypothetical protein
MLFMSLGGLVGMARAGDGVDLDRPCHLHPGFVAWCCPRAWPNWTVAGRSGDGPRRQPHQGVLPDHPADHRAAIAAAWLLAFTLSLDDVVVASFVSGPNSTTLPMVVFSSARRGLNPQVNALATIMIVAVSAAAFVGWWLMNREEKRRRRDLRLASRDGE